MPPREPPLAEYALRYAAEGVSSRLLTRKPLFLTVFVTARCGLSCGHCFYRDELLSGSHKHELSLDEYDRMTRRLPRFPKLIITGGEPFLREDLCEIAEKFYENQSQARQITIPTAGAHTERIVDLVERLLEPRPDLILELQLSIDGVGDKHDAIRGKGSFEKLMRTHDALRPIQDRNSGLRIRFNYTFGRMTQDHFAETHRFVSETLGNPHFDMVLVRRKTIEDQYWGEVDVEKYRAAAALLQEMERKKAGDDTLKRMLAQRVRVEREIIAEHSQGRAKMTGCLAGTLTAIISETGEVRPCEVLDQSFGNLRGVDFDFEALWHGHTAQEFRHWVKETGCFCTFETCVRTTMSFQPRWYASMAKGFVQDLAAGPPGSKVG